MKTSLLFVLVVLALSGCSDSVRKSIENSPQDYACLTPGAQIALALWFPLTIAAAGVLINGITLVKIRRTTKAEKKEDPKS